MVCPTFINGKDVEYGKLRKLVGHIYIGFE